MDQPINIFSYSDFRPFIRDSYQAHHKKDRAFSQRYIARMLGEKSPSFLQKIVDNKRRLNPHQIESIIHIFNLTAHEAKFFRVLYLYSTASSRIEQELYLEQLIDLNHTPRRELTQDLMQYYRHWYHPAIRAILSVKPMGDNFKYLASLLRPKITAPQAHEAISLLAKLHLIAKNDAGLWIPTDENLFAKDPFHSVILQNYRQQCLDLASEVLASRPSESDLLFSTGTMSVSSEAHQRIMNKLEKFRAEVRSIVRKDSKPPCKVIHLQTQAFPLMEALS